MHMKKNATLRTLLILGIIFLITYALADGIRYGSGWGITMALMSFIALAFSIQLAGKLKKIKEEEEEEA